MNATQEAQRITRVVFAAKEERPAVKFIALQRILESLLIEGFSIEECRQAAMSTQYFTENAILVQIDINRKAKQRVLRSNGSAESTKPPDPGCPKCGPMAGWMRAENGLSRECLTCHDLYPDPLWKKS